MNASPAAGQHRSWQALIPESEWKLYRQAGYGHPLRAGDRPALLVVDATYRFVGTREPQAASMAVYPSSTDSHDDGSHYREGSQQAMSASFGDSPLPT